MYRLFINKIYFPPKSKGFTHSFYSFCFCYFYMWHLFYVFKEFPRSFYNRVLYSPGNSELVNWECWRLYHCYLVTELLLFLQIHSCNINCITNNERKGLLLKLQLLCVGFHHFSSDRLLGSFLLVSLRERGNFILHSSTYYVETIIFFNLDIHCFWISLHLCVTQ